MTCPSEQMCSSACFFEVNLMLHMSHSYSLCLSCTCLSRSLAALNGLPQARHLFPVLILLISTLCTLFSMCTCKSTSISGDASSSSASSVISSELTSAMALYVATSVIRSLFLLVKAPTVLFRLSMLILF